MIIENTDTLLEFQNILDISSDGREESSDALGNNPLTPFVDMGAWHGYYHIRDNMKNLYGGFVGPMIINEEYSQNISSCINKIEEINLNGKCISIECASNMQQHYYPGRLVQSYDFHIFNLNIELIFVTSRTALIKIKIKNTSESRFSFKLTWSGSVFNEENIIENNDEFKEVIINLDRITEKKFIITYGEDIVTHIKKSKYVSSLKSAMELIGGEEKSLYVTQCYVFNEEELLKEREAVNNIFKSCEELFGLNRLKWERYINETFKNPKLELKDKRLIVKAIETMITNWRSEAGAIKYGGVTPSITYKWFNGLWAWDSFKHSVALAYFNEELAKDSVRAMFYYQIEDDDKVRPQDFGAIIDAVFYNKSIEREGHGENWNERNSKPPIAAWAVWNIYIITKDRKFLKEMYPKLVKYHNWWYVNRDFDNNGICEYGAMIHPLNCNEEEIIKAAAWESGMDNAPRFDRNSEDNHIKLKIVENVDSKGKILSYSLNQESVDLNSYLYAEKGYLAKIARELKNNLEEKTYLKQREYIKNYIQTRMYHKKTGFFYDLRKEYEDEELINYKGMACEGFIPLWAKVASKEQAKEIVENIMDENKFNTYFPFPTVSKDSSNYNPKEYWRGPVWLDQAYFALEGLKNYGYEKEAIYMVEKLFNNGENLLYKGTIRENYNPETGEGLNASNFSWSSAAYYLIYKSFLEK